jgi:hypothetical protein
MENKGYAKGDEVFIKQSYGSGPAGTFAKLERKADHTYPEGTWLVLYADRLHAVHEDHFGFVVIPSVPGTPRFKRGDRVLSKCPGHTFDKVGTVLELVKLVTNDNELYRLRFADGSEVTMSLTWMQEAPQEGPAYVKGDKVELTVSWEAGKIVTIESYNGINDSGEYYTTLDDEGVRGIYSIQWLKDAPVEPEPKYKKGDKVHYSNGFNNFFGTVVGNSNVPNEQGEYVYLVDNKLGKPRWCAEVYLEAVPRTDTFKDQLQAGDRVKFKYGRQCGEVLELDNESFPVERYRVRWDHSGKVYTESRRALEVLYAPRTTDDPLPMQAEIDRVDKLREPIIQQVAELQRQLGELNKIKAKLKQV